MEDKMDFLLKLAAGVDDGKKSEKPEGSESGAKKDGKKSPFPPKKDGGKPGFPPKKDGGKPGFKEKKDGNEQGDESQNGGDEEGKNPANGSEQEGAVGGEQEIEGNESAEGPAIPGSSNIDPTAVFDFFAQNPSPNDEAYHEFAESSGFDVHAAEAAAYALAGKYIMFLRGGKSQGLDPNSVDPEQLQMGIEVEAEHSDDPTTRKKIAMDHLAENPQYYTALQQMESGMGGGGEQSQPEEAAVTPEQKNNQKGVSGQQTVGDGDASMRS
jgi:hypothetical protein